MSEQLFGIYCGSNDKFVGMSRLLNADTNETTLSAHWTDDINDKGYAIKGDDIASTADWVNMATLAPSSGSGIQGEMVLAQLFNLFRDYYHSGIIPADQFIGSVLLVPLRPNEGGVGFTPEFILSEPLIDD